MNALRLVVGLALALVIQAMLGGLWPESLRYVDILLVPVVLVGISGSQRAAMAVGCGAGLLQDAWFHVGTFGLSGFKKTLIGWVLGGIASRLDLNQASGRAAAGALAALGDRLLDQLLRRLLDLEAPVPGGIELLAVPLVSGLLVALAGHILERVNGRRAAHHPV